MSRAPQAPTHSHVLWLLVPLLHLSARRVFIAAQCAGTEHTPQTELSKLRGVASPLARSQPGSRSRVLKMGTKRGITGTVSGRVSMS